MLLAAWFDRLEEKYLLFFHWHAKLRQNELVTLTLIVFIYFTFLIIKSFLYDVHGQTRQAKLPTTRTLFPREILARDELSFSQGN